MEKFHQYCLTVLLVIICNNISAHSTANGVVDHHDYKRLCEVYSTLVNAQNGNETSCLSKREREIYYTLNQKQKVCDIAEPLFNKQFHIDSNMGAKTPGDERYNQILFNFKNISNSYEFAETPYLKSKVSKIRNKDYLDLIS